MKPQPSRRSIEKMRERERDAGLDPDDAAAQWLGEHEPKEEPPMPKAARKSKLLHRWKQAQQRRD